VNQLGSVALVFVSVVKEGITHANHASLFFAYEVLELLVPHPVLGILRGSYLVSKQLLYHIYVVDDVKDQSFYFREK
jgi:hypothetical protein